MRMIAFMNDGLVIKQTFPLNLMDGFLHKQIYCTRTKSMGIVKTKPQIKMETGDWEDISVG